MEERDQIKWLNTKFSSLKNLRLFYISSLNYKKKKKKNLCCAFELKHLIMPSLNYLNTYFPFTHFNQLFYQNLNPVHSFPTQTKSLKEKKKKTPSR